MDTVATAWTNLCLPGKVYLVLALLGILTSLASPSGPHTPSKPVMLISNVVWAALWVWIIAGLCSAGWIKTAWLVAVGLPVLVLLIIVGAVLGYFAEKVRTPL